MYVYRPRRFGLCRSLTNWHLISQPTTNSSFFRTSNFQVATCRVREEGEKVVVGIHSGEELRRSEWGEE